MDRRVIARKHLPTNLPVTSCGLALLALDRFHAPGWAWGVVCCLFFIFFVVSIYCIVTEKEFAPKLEER